MMHHAVLIASRTRGLFAWQPRDGQDAALISPTEGLAALASSADGHTVYGVGGSLEGWLQAWSYSAAAWTAVARLGTDGATPCHVSVDHAGRVVVANHSTGTIVRFRVTSAGTPEAGAEILRHDQDGRSRPHQVLHTMSGLAMIDLGTDEVFQSDAAHSTRWERIVALPPGTGPRHGVVSDGAVVAVSAERAGGVSVCMEHHWTTIPSTQLRNHPVSRGTRNAPGDLLLRGDYLYVANRGYDTIGIVDRRSAELVDEVPVGGRWPQHLVDLGDRLLVACEDSNELRSLRWLQDGRLAPSQHEVECPHPAWLLAPPLPSAG